MEESIDFERLRSDLKDLFMAAMFNGFPVAIMDVTRVENASNEELIEIAKQNRFDLEKYKIRHK